MSLARSLALPSLFCLTALGWGCAPRGVTAREWQPAHTDTGAARVLALTDATGPHAATGMVLDAALRQIDVGGWFIAVDAVQGGRLEVDRNDDGARLSDGEMDAAAVYLRLDVVEQRVDVDSEERELVDELGAPVLDEYGDALTSTVDVVRGTTALSATLARGDGIVLLRAFEVTGEHSGDELSELEALQVSTDAAVAAVLAELTPTQSAQFLAFDLRGDDADQRAVADLAERDQLDDALALEDELLARAPTPSGRYHRGILLDVRGDYAGALDAYDAAQRGADATLLELIADAEAGARRRAADRAHLAP